MRGDPPGGDSKAGPDASQALGFAHAQSAGRRGALAGVRILVVEDDDDSREMVFSVLQMEGATVLCVSSVAEAMGASCHAFDPDVVLTDFSMPDADGIDLIREFRKAPSTRSVAPPILMLSGHHGLQLRAAALEAGAAEVMAKPFEPLDLIARIIAASAAGGQKA
jgi:DNA-binding response OmpR family regulator